MIGTSLNLETSFCITAGHGYVSFCRQWSPNWQRKRTIMATRKLETKTGFQKSADQTSLLLLLLLLLNTIFHSIDYFSNSGWFLFHMIFWRLYSFLFSFIFVDYVFGVTLEKLEKTHCQEECWGNLLSHTYSWLTSSAFAYFFLCSLPVFSFHSFKKHFIFVFCKMQEFMFF